jgi:drug/metabolite transporter (DMT)-like permease
MLSPRLGILILAGVGISFAANHTAARIAFDHGATVAAGVSVRATTTALVLLVMMRLQRVSLSVPGALLPWALLAGVLIAAQSYCLYSAVARIPPALALLVFQISPMLYVLLCWTMGKEPPRWSALPPMLLGLVGLAFALDLELEHLGARWNEIGAGVLWALASSASMAGVYYLNGHVLKSMDGRLRTFVMTAVTATLVIAGGTAAESIAFPRDATGWAGLAGLAMFYCVAMITLFFVLPRLPATSTVTLNVEPIALLFLGWLFLGHTVTPLQILGAFLTVGAIVWLGVSKR